MKSTDRETAGVYATTAILILTAVGLAYGTKMASPHEAKPTPEQPLGWTYGWECCNLMDCREVADGFIEEPTSDRQSYRVKSTGEEVPVSSTKIKKSKDERFHWCAHQTGPNAGKTICIYVPNRGF